jgi:hypothetical protein
MLIDEYIAAALCHATFEALPEGGVFGWVLGYPGLWAYAWDQEACATELRALLPAWILFTARNDPLPQAYAKLPTYDGQALDMAELERLRQHPPTGIRWLEVVHRADRTVRLPPRHLKVIGDDLLLRLLQEAPAPATHPHDEAPRHDGASNSHAHPVHSRRPHRSRRLS